MEGTLRLLVLVSTAFLKYLSKIILSIGLPIILIHHLSGNYGQSFAIDLSTTSVSRRAQPAVVLKLSGIGMRRQIPQSRPAKTGKQDWFEQLKLRIQKERQRLAARARREAGFRKQKSRSLQFGGSKNEAKMAQAQPATAPGEPKAEQKLPAGSDNLLDEGVASYYGKRWNGRKTANGEIFDCNKLTAAHKTLPFGSYVRVVRQDNGRAIVVRINDRGPFKKGRVIDLSSGAARRLDMLEEGLVGVRVYPATLAEFLQQFMQ